MVKNVSPRLTFNAVYTYPEGSNHDGYERACTDATDVIKHIMDWPLADTLQLFHQLYSHQAPKTRLTP